MLKWEHKTPYLHLKTVGATQSDKSVGWQPLHTRKTLIPHSSTTPCENTASLHFSTDSYVTTNLFACEVNEEYKSVLCFNTLT